MSRDFEQADCHCTSARFARAIFHMPEAIILGVVWVLVGAWAISCGLQNSLQWSL